MKTKYVLILGLVLLGLLVMMNTASADIDLGSQAKNGDGTTADTIFITGQSATIKDVFDDADVTTAHLAEISSGSISRYLLNCSIQVNESGILVIDTFCDWLMLSSIDGAIANITSYGRLFINGSLVTAVIPATGGLNNSANDTLYSTGARTRPSIRVNNSEGSGDGAFGLASAKIAYLGGATNESFGGVSINDTGGSPVFTSTASHISFCHNGLFIKSIISGTAISGLNVTDCDVIGVRLDSDSAINFTNCNFSSNGVADLVTHSDVVSTLNNTHAQALGTEFIYSPSVINNCTQKFRTVSRSRGNTAWNLTANPWNVLTSDNDYCNLNVTSTSAWTGETLDADFVEFVIGGFSGGSTYVMSIVEDGTNIPATSCVNGWTTFNYTGTWSTKTFSVLRQQTGGSYGGGASVPTVYTTYYKCVNGQVLSQEFPNDPGSGWSLTRPSCGADSKPTVSPSLAVDGEVSDTTVAVSVLVIIGAFLALWKVPWFKRFGANKWLIFIALVIFTLIALGLW